MLRWCLRTTTLLCLLLTVTMSAAIIYGQRHRGELLAYVGEYLQNIYLMDVEKQISFNVGIREGITRNIVASDNGVLAFAPYGVSGWVFTWDGTTLIQMPHEELGAEGSPAWSADGRLAYIKCLSFQPCDIYISDGGITQNIIHINNRSLDEPAWSPDGRLAFTACNDENTECELMLWDGVSISNITDTIDSFLKSPLWSPDGRLAFLVCDSRQSVGCDIWIWDGTTLLNLPTDPMGYNRDPAWSPDGRLAFSSCLANTCDISIWDGQTLYDLTNTPEMDEFRVQWNNEGVLAYFSCPFRGYTCDVVTWNGTFRSVLLPSSRHRLYFSWIGHDDMVLSFCEDSCGLWRWDGVQLTHITDVFYTDEAYPVWLP